ncbi:MAG: hypothetical protein CMO43_14010 [Verrucomicrobiales bacterium]|jgi:hypothetical protein|nr:hypothetical protein [Verrucomicrobiales bacterium]MDP6421117.1 hypothetical protein [SAR202 cluster bacterium]
MRHQRILPYVCLIAISITARSLWAVTVTDTAFDLTVRTSLYEAVWAKAGPMGLTTVTLSETNKDAMSAGKLYHDLDYRGGRHNWGDEEDTEVLIKRDDSALLEITSHDDRELGYRVVALFWDSAPYFRLEITVTLDKGAEEAAWPITGYDPLLEPGVGVDWDDAAHVGDIALSDDPNPHAVYWTGDTFLGLYADSSKSKARFGDWQANNTVIRLDHGRQAKNLQPNDSNTIAYYVGFGAGGEAEAHALAAEIAAGTPADPRSVAPRGKLRLTWAGLKRR